jgi:NitT/TauT family transport system substrate-binding protein
MTVTRIAALFMAALALCGASPSIAQDKVSLRLNWYLGGLHVPFYYGKDRGYYAAEGIDLTINEGRGSANTVQVVAAGSDTFGPRRFVVGDPDGVEGCRHQERDVAAQHHGILGRVRWPRRPSRHRRTSRARRWPSPRAIRSGALLQAVCKANSVDCAKISMVQVDPAAKVVTVLEKKTDALLGGADDQYFLIKYKGANPVAMRYADFGANIVGMTILTSGDTIKKNPDLVKRFVRATAKSWEEAKKNPGAAVDAAMKAKPDLNRQSTLDQLMVDIDLLDSKNSKGRIGWGAQADWDQTLAILKNYRELQTDKGWTTFHTNEFVPQ